jgi:hypothetical protein
MVSTAHIHTATLFFFFSFFLSNTFSFTQKFHHSKTHSHIHGSHSQHTQNTYLYFFWTHTHTQSLHRAHTHIHLSLSTHILLPKSHTNTIYMLYHKLVNLQSLHHTHALYKFQLTDFTCWFLSWKFLLTTKEVHKCIYIYNQLLFLQRRKKVTV